jgi:hypothetical protein
VRDGWEEASHAAKVAHARVEEAVDDYPVGVGAVALAAGILIGALIPRTRHEDEWMGEASDEFVSSARQIGRQALDQAEEVAATTAQIAIETAEEEGLTPEALGDRIKSVGQQVSDAAKKALRDEKLTASQLIRQGERVAQEAGETAEREAKQAARKITENPNT